MSASIDIRGLDRAFGKLITASSKGALQRDLVEMLHESGPPLMADIKGSASSRIERRAAESVRVDRVSTGIKVEGGSGGGLSSTLFPGGEFGGRASRKRSYSRTQVFGRPALGVQKRATMMFKPHLGTEGYFFWPTVRDWLPKLRRQAEETTEKALT